MLRQVCWTQLPDWQHHINDNIITVPYSSMVNLKLPRHKHVGIKKTLVFYKGGCSNDTGRSPGQKMRFHAVQQIGMSSPDVVVECACR